MMEYIIIAIGDEILAGQVTDTNSGAIARIMEPEGFCLRRTETIADSAEALTEAVERAMGECSLVITTGGLGPTKDDNTKQTLCSLFESKLVESLPVLENVKRVVNARGFRLNELTARQALVPECATVVQNEVGTAPILWFERPKDRVLVCMPGVPFETLHMLRSKVLPLLCTRFGNRQRKVRHTVMTYGITESDLAQALAPFEDSLPPYAHLAYLPKPRVVRLRLDGDGHEPEMAALAEKLASCIPSGHLLAVGDITAEEELINRLRHRGATVATAESCTGGTIASRIASVAGASDVFQGGVIAYSNHVKTCALDVPAGLITAHGAVSEQVVRAMAEGARRRIGADYAVATSGIAGPSGGSALKPVGTVWMAVATPASTIAWAKHFPGTRDRVIDRASTETMLRLIKEL